MITPRQKQRLALFIGLGLPLLFIILVAALIYFPSLNLRTDQDFLYTSSYSSDTYEVANGFLKERPIDRDSYSNYSGSYRPDYPQIHRYHSKSGSSESIGFEEARRLRLNTNTVSKGGVEIIESDTRSLAVGWGYSSGSDGPYIKKGIATKVIKAGDGYDFKFLGWVE